METENTEVIAQEEAAEETLVDTVEAPEKDIAAENALAAANSRAEVLEARLYCIDKGVNAEYSEDVVALAQRLGGDINASIEMVLEKYPFFCKITEEKSSPKLTTGVHFVQPAKNSCGGVESAFRKSNPNIKL